MLISPPSSPPDDWQPVPESNPVINYELVAALAALVDDTEEVELQPETNNTPRLVLQGSSQSDD